MKNLNVQDITHTSCNSSLKHVTLHCETSDGKTTLITMHPALLFAASQQAMQSFQYVLECEMNGVEPPIEE